MKLIELLISTLKAFFGMSEAKAKNAPLNRLKELDEEITKTRHEILAAARLGNSSGVSELQDRLNNLYTSRKALRDAESNASK